jgi:hypothetical protein
MSLPPIELCPQCNEYVHRGQTQKECATAHVCAISLERCPLKQYFAAMLDGGLPYRSTRAINPFTYK